MSSRSKLLHKNLTVGAGSSLREQEYSYHEPYQYEDSEDEHDHLDYIAEEPLEEEKSKSPKTAKKAHKKYGHDFSSLMKTQSMPAAGGMSSYEAKKSETNKSAEKLYPTGSIGEGTTARSLSRKESNRMMHHQSRQDSINHHHHHQMPLPPADNSILGDLFPGVPSGPALATPGNALAMAGVSPDIAALYGLGGAGLATAGLGSGLGSFTVPQMVMGPNGPVVINVPLQAPSLVPNPLHQLTTLPGAHQFPGPGYSGLVPHLGITPPGAEIQVTPRRSSSGTYMKGQKTLSIKSKQMSHDNSYGSDSLRKDRKPWSVGQFADSELQDLEPTVEYAVQKTPNRSSQRESLTHQYPGSHSTGKGQAKGYGGKKTYWNRFNPESAYSADLQYYNALQQAQHQQQAQLTSAYYQGFQQYQRDQEMLMQRSLYGEESKAYLGTVPSKAGQQQHHYEEHAAAGQQQHQYEEHAAEAHKPNALNERYRKNNNWGFGQGQSFAKHVATVDKTCWSNPDDWILSKKKIEWHEEALRMGKLFKKDTIFCKGPEYNDLLSTLSETEIRHGGIHRYCLKFREEPLTQSELGGLDSDGKEVVPPAPSSMGFSMADGVGFVFSNKLPCAKNIQRIQSIFVSRKGIVCIRRKTDVTRCKDFALRPFNNGDFIFCQIDLDKGKASFWIEPPESEGMTDGPPKGSVFDYSACFPQFGQGKLDKGFITSVIKFEGVSSEAISYHLVMPKRVDVNHLEGVTEVLSEFRNEQSPERGNERSPEEKHQ